MTDRATISRTSETVKQRETRLQDMADKATTSRASETVQQRESRLQDIRDRARRSRTAQNYCLALEGFYYDPHKDYSQLPSVTIGSMEIVCSHCEAKSLSQSFLLFAAKLGR
jgi:hypothetical protein